MKKRDLNWNRIIAASVISLSVVLFALIIAGGVKNRNASDNSIVVTGMSQTNFTSDLIVWQGTFSRINMNLEKGYRELNNDMQAVRKYLLSKGVKESEIVFSAVDYYKKFDTRYFQGGGYEQKFAGYELSQSVTIQSAEVDKIEAIQRESSQLINQGIEFNSQAPQYYYTKLAELKLQMIEDASADARKRADNIVKSAEGKIGSLQNASMGVFQITAQNANENYESGGAFNTWSKDKTASITVRLRYQVK